MDGADDWTDPSIGYRWIKANVYGALVITALGLATYALRHALAVGEPDIGPVARWLFVAAGTLFTALGLAVYGRLTAGVLARKLPGFPVRTWVLLYAVLGLATGAFLSATETGDVAVEADVDSDAILGAVLTMLISGVLLGAAWGAVQGLVMRKVARGLRRWIGYSALSGPAVGLALVVALYGPSSGLSRELMVELANVVVTMIAAIILLPAVRRLEPRAPAAPAAAPPAES